MIWDHGCGKKEKELIEKREERGGRQNAVKSKGSLPFTVSRKREEDPANPTFQSKEKIVHDFSKLGGLEEQEKCRIRMPGRVARLRIIPKIPISDSNRNSKKYLGESRFPVLRESSCSIIGKSSKTNSFRIESNKELRDRSPRSNDNCLQEVIQKGMKGIIKNEESRLNQNSTSIEEIVKGLTRDIQGKISKINEIEREVSNVGVECKVPTKISLNYMHHVNRLAKYVEDHKEEICLLSSQLQSSIRRAVAKYEQTKNLNLLSQTSAFHNKGTLDNSSQVTFQKKNHPNNNGIQIQTKTKPVKKFELLTPRESKGAAILKKEIESTETKTPTLKPNEQEGRRIIIGRRFNKMLTDPAITSCYDSDDFHHPKPELLDRFKMLQVSNDQFQPVEEENQIRTAEFHASHHQKQEIRIKPALKTQTSLELQFNSKTSADPFFDFLTEYEQAHTTQKLKTPTKRKTVRFFDAIVESISSQIDTVLPSASQYISPSQDECT